VRLGGSLADGIRALGLAVDDATLAKLLDYVALLDKWNRTYNLTAIRERGRIVTHHLLDSLAVLEHFPQTAKLRVLDVGSGAGLPGIPIALARPWWDVALLDSNAKKAAFLRQAIAELGLANAEVVAMRIEDYRPVVRYDVAVSRAFANLDAFVGATVSLVHASGRLLAMKGSLPRDEIEAVAGRVRVVAVPRIEVPGLDAERHLVIMEPRAA
jgi:16S rRNA (guanine527-N7)-methyltransferase